MVKCFIVGCTSGYKSNNGKIPSFRSPRNDKQLLLWRKAIARSDRKFSYNDRVCAKHFKEEDIIKTRVILNQPYALRRWKLVPQSVPSINLGLPQEEEKANRRSPKKNNVGVMQSSADDNVGGMQSSNLHVLANTVEDIEMVVVKEEEDINSIYNEGILEQEDIFESAAYNPIVDPTEAKLPPSWRWLPDCEVYEPDDPTANKKIAVRIAAVNNAPVITKSITVLGNEVFYSVMGKMIATPKFLPQFVKKVEKISDLVSNFEKASLCRGLEFAPPAATRPSKAANTNVNLLRRSQFCLRILERGSICYKCGDYNKKVMEKAKGNKNGKA